MKHVLENIVSTQHRRSASVSLGMQFRHPLTQNTKQNSRTIYCSLEKWHFFHFPVKQWPCARFEFTTRWSSTFLKFECFCCHGNKLLMKISTRNWQITRDFQVNSARALWESAPFSTPIPLKCLCLYLLFPSESTNQTERTRVSIFQII